MIKPISLEIFTTSYFSDYTDNHENIFLVENLNDVLYFINKGYEFKVVGGLTNTVLVGANKERKILVYQNQEDNPILLIDQEGRIEVNANMKLAYVVKYIIDGGFDAVHLLGIPGTVGGAFVNNSGSGQLGLSLVDNLEYITYYNKEGRPIILFKDNIIYGKRFSEFKHMDNIFIYKIGLKFSKENRQILIKKTEERLIYRKKFEYIYKYPSLGTLYIKNNYESIENTVNHHFILRNNKIIYRGKQKNNKNFSDFITCLDKKYYAEKEIEIYNYAHTCKGIYVGFFLYDSKGNFILQKRDLNKFTENKGMFSLFGGGVEQGETILKGLKREIKEELGKRIYMKNIIKKELFIKKYKTTYLKCFIFYYKVSSVYKYIQNINCMEGQIIVKNMKNIHKIISSKRCSIITKKSILYAF